MADGGNGPAPAELGLTQKELRIEDSHLKGERIPQTEVARLAEDFGNFYNLDPETIERAKPIEAYLVGDEEFKRIAEGQIKSDLDWSMQVLESLEGEDLDSELLRKTKEEHDLMRKNPELVKALISRHSQQNEGAAQVVTLPDREFVILRDTINPQNRTATLEHEMLHVLASSGFEGGTGLSFYDTALGYEYEPLNESATQVLWLHKRYPDASALRLSSAIHNTDFLYENGTQILLDMLGTTLLSGNPLSIENLALHYFSKRESKLTDKTSELIRVFEKHTPEEFKGGIKAKFEKLK